VSRRQGVNAVCSPVPAWGGQVVVFLPAESIQLVAVLLRIAPCCHLLGDARINERDFEGNTPLLLACQAGSVEVATMLMDAGADVNASNRKGDTPLLLACQAESVEVATKISAAGADVLGAGMGT
jgi:hypothetical protein